MSKKDVVQVECDNAKREWNTWQEVVKLWPGKMNDPEWNRLVRTIQLWGEHLVALRIVQPEGTRSNALRGAEQLLRECG